MAVKIQSINELIDKSGLKILIHGEAGAGKTVMSATAGAPTLIISAESGLLSLEGCPDTVQATEIKNLNQLAEVYTYLTTTNHPYEWVVLDSISEIGEVCLASEKRESRDNRMAYGNMIDHMVTILKNFRDIKLNIVMTCKQERVADADTGRTHYSPSLPGSRLGNEIPYLFDIVGALRVEKNQETGEIYRVLQTNSDSRYLAKDRSGKLEFYEEPNLKTIFDKIFPRGIEKPAAPEPTPTEQKTRFFYDPELKEVFTIDNKEPNDYAKNNCVELTEDEYNEFLAEQKEQ